MIVWLLLRMTLFSHVIHYCFVVKNPISILKTNRLKNNNNKKTLLSKAHILQDTLLKVAWKDLTKGEELLYTNSLGINSVETLCDNIFTGYRLTVG